MKLCILLSTCESYRRIAEFTCSRIDRLWAYHPPIFCCGSNSGNKKSWLPLVDEQTDWMKILFTATFELIDRGYSQVYLILDDHPPLWKCHEKHLNKTIPEMMAQLKAVYMGLNGWGQGRALTGSIMNNNYFRVENVSQDYLWKFQLHPALWDLFFLHQLLKGMIEKLPVELHSPWAFERRTGTVEADIPEEWKKSSYRICGQSMTRSSLRKNYFFLVRWIVKVMRFFAGKIIGIEAWKKIDQGFAFLFQYYEGPYPLIWSGAIKKGKLNKDLIRYLKFHGKIFFLNELKKSLALTQGFK